MPLCEKCSDLVGKSAEVDPHSALKSSGVGLTVHEGNFVKVRNQFHCDHCGSWMYQGTEHSVPPNRWYTGPAPGDWPDESQDGRREVESNEYYVRERLRQRRAALYMSASFATITIGLLVLYVNYVGSFRVDVPKVLGIFTVFLGAVFFAISLGLSQTKLIDIDFLRKDRKKKGLDPSLAYPFPVGPSGDSGGEWIPARSLDPFETYFMELKGVLEDRARDADRKASVLLDKGTAYTRWGIIFFVATIIAWQVMSHFYGFKTEYIYGIVSCSGLFIFIEFLSAWFLKQYRNYIDTSTYLLKVKAIFDRYMLVYLANQGRGSLEGDEQKRAEFLLEMLAKDISWPDSYLLKKQDIGFAKDAMKAVGSLAKELRRKEKSAKEKTAE